jgi:anti-anti-sigma regulatory factor
LVRPPGATFLSPQRLLAVMKGRSAMRDPLSSRVHTDVVNGVTVFRILDRELRDPACATELFEDVKQQTEKSAAAWVLIDLAQTKYLSGMAFVAMMSLAQRISTARGRLALCNLDPYLRARAQLLQLQPYLEIYDDEASALASF